MGACARICALLFLFICGSLSLSLSLAAGHQSRPPTPSDRPHDPPTSLSLFLAAGHQNRPPAHPDRPRDLPLSLSLPDIKPNSFSHPDTPRALSSRSAPLPSCSWVTGFPALLSASIFASRHTARAEQRSCGAAPYVGEAPFPMPQATACATGVAHPWPSVASTGFVEARVSCAREQGSAAVNAASRPACTRGLCLPQSGAA